MLKSINLLFFGSGGSLGCKVNSKRRRSDTREVRSEQTCEHSKAGV